MFANREEGAKKLAKDPTLLEFAGSQDVIVLGIPRGGVVCAAAVAGALKLPLSIVVTRKIAAPGNPEFAIGAVGESGEAVWNDKAAGFFSARDRKKMEQEARAEAVRRNRVFDTGKEKNLIGKTVILVDDGLATGMTMLAAVNEARYAGAGRVIVATPVAPPDTVQKLRKVADAVVVLKEPVNFAAVGQFYEDFPQVSDEEVLQLLQRQSKS